MLQSRREDVQQSVLRLCLRAFLSEGTLDLSLDQIAAHVSVSKRMLIHYFGSRESLEERAIDLLENRLRAQFAPETFARGVKLRTVVAKLWETTTAPQARGVLLLTMDVCRRAWNGSPRAVNFYAAQQQLWIELLLRFHDDRRVVEEIVQLFQGGILAYLINGDAEPGRRALDRAATAASKRT